MQNILVPTDFSEEASNALDVAIEIVQLTKGKITLFHVVDIPAPISSINIAGDYISPVPENLYLMELMESSKNRMAGLIKEQRLSKVSFQHKIVFGSIYSSIELETNESKIDLIVMGSKGSSGLDEFLIGSTSEHVVRRVKVPVLTVKKKQEKFSIKDIVFATNLAEDQGVVLAKVKRLQELFDSTIHLLKVNSPDHFEDTKTIKKEMAHFVQKYQMKNYTINIYDAKVTEAGIINFAEEINANLIAMGTHGRTGIAHIITGSIAEDVVNHASRMVLTVNMNRS